MYLLGFDLGSSSVKVSLLNAETGALVASDFSPRQEMPMQAVQSGWAEQHPDLWWENLRTACQQVLQTAAIDKTAIKAIGISYQMHGLVVVDKDKNVLRPSIIWCDSRAVEIGEQAFRTIGSNKSLQHLLNSPGNFTASKLRWVKENEPELYEKIYKFMLPGDWLAMKLTGELQTTTSGLSEGVFYDFKNEELANFLFRQYELDTTLVPDIVPTFAEQATLSKTAADELGLPKGIPVAYRAGDQPNNAYSLNVLNPGEIAATAGTSGVIYGVNAEANYDAASRVNIFAHVNHRPAAPRLGVLLCINGTGILYNWLRQHTGGQLSYEAMNDLANKADIGSNGVLVLPFGNGAERVLENKNLGCQILNLDFNQHHQGHLYRAAQEGIAFSLYYGLQIMQEMGCHSSVVRAGKANLFLSPLFRQTMANISGATIELFNTDGARGAARAAGVGAGVYSSFEESFVGLKKLETIAPQKEGQEALRAAYENWVKALKVFL